MEIEFRESKKGERFLNRMPKNPITFTILLEVYNLAKETMGKVNLKFYIYIYISPIYLLKPMKTEYLKYEGENFWFLFLHARSLKVVSPS